MKKDDPDTIYLVPEKRSVHLMEFLIGCTATVG